MSGRQHPLPAEKSGAQCPPRASGAGVRPEGSRVGAALPGPRRSEFETALGADFSLVRLLSQLNEWEQKYGSLGAGRGWGSNGEVPARIDELKRLLRGQGADVSWNGTEYVLASPNPEGNAP